jgi:nitrate reductase molybdenum cofactor assembly chaperone NarJ/NarW
MAVTFKALSALLCYPDEDLQAAAGDIAALIRSENLVDPDVRRELDRLVDEFEHRDLFDLQERYVDLFDKTRRLSLHLFEHVHGESRDRGQAMVDLAALYEQGGLTLSVNELPDYLPLFLEYLSTRPIDEARTLLADAIHIIAAVEERLAQRKSPYAAVFSAIRSVAGVRLSTPATAISQEPDHDDLAALDAAWEETAVTFGPGEAGSGCSVDRLKTQMRAARRDVQHAPI